MYVLEQKPANLDIRLSHLDGGMSFLLCHYGFLAPIMNHLLHGSRPEI